jgi:hypothetical protein
MALAALSAGAALLAGCVTAPPPPPPPRVYQEAPPPNTNVYAYPLHGQPAEQEDRDRYECSQWATQQTGFNPSAAGVPPHEQVQVVTGPPPGTNTAIGAVAGAVLGAAISRPWQAAGGALAGAVVGGAIGSAADASNAQTARSVAISNRQAAAAYETQAANYRRAVGACLEGRGYSVR